jgi:SAM-dependent methyltransferase
MTIVQCRSCRAPLSRTFVDLGSMPPANSYVPHSESDRPEQSYPLHAKVCEQCLLVQVDHELAPSEIFSDYAYFSSVSSSWLEHARRFCEDALERWSLGPESLVVEVASNDGYLLRNFVAAGVPVLGIEPAANVAAVAVDVGVRTEARFFGVETAHDLVDRGLQADLVVGNNVLAHVPDLNDFVAGLAAVLKPEGVLSVEFPHLANLVAEVQFDTIYHEHFSYLSLIAVEAAFERHGLRVFDVEQIPTHGGSLRLSACLVGASHPDGHGLQRVRALERERGLHRLETYDGFPQRVEECLASLRDFLATCRAEGKVVVGYGAAAKGNTLLNSAHATPDDIPFVVDRSPHKQDHLLPGTRIPVKNPAVVDEVKPAYLLILPWNIVDEVEEQMAHVSAWGCRFVTAVPEVRVRA